LGFVCKECILLSNCSELCNKVISLNTELSKHLLSKYICPDCGSKMLYMYKCSNCNHTFIFKFSGSWERYRDRHLKAEWTIETIQDLRCIYGIDLESDLIKGIEDDIN